MTVLQRLVRGRETIALLGRRIWASGKDRDSEISEKFSGENGLENSPQVSRSSFAFSGAIFRMINDRSTLEFVVIFCFHGLVPDFSGGIS